MAESFFQKVTQDPNQFMAFAREVERDPSQLSKALVNSDGTLAVQDKATRDNFLVKLVDQTQHDYDAHARAYLQSTREAQQRGLPTPPDNAALPKFELSGAFEHGRNVELKVSGQTTPIYSDKVVAKVNNGQLEHFEDVKVGSSEIKIPIAPTVTCSQPGQTYWRKQDCF